MPNFSWHIWIFELPCALGNFITKWKTFLNWFPKNSVSFTFWRGCVILGKDCARQIIQEVIQDSRIKKPKTEPPLINSPSYLATDFDTINQTFKLLFFIFSIRVSYLNESWFLWTPTTTSTIAVFTSNQITISWKNQNTLSPSKVDNIERNWSDIDSTFNKASNNGKK